MGLIVETARVPMRDGTVLTADVLRPDRGGPLPVLLSRTPYGRAHSRQVEDVVGMARAGWAVVVQDVRGRGESGGVFEPFHQEIADGADTVRWCARQPWSDGKVAMFGASYRAATQWLAARAGPPGLVAISPSVSPAGFAEGWTFEGGVPVLGFTRAWALGLAASGSAPDEKAARRAAELRDLPPEPIAEEPWGEIFPPARNWGTSPKQKYWANIAGGGTAPPVAGFHVAGWHDVFCEGALAAFRAARHSGKPQRLVVGPWTHGDVGGRVAGELDQGVNAEGARVGLAEERLRWLRAALKPEAADLGVTVSVFEMGADRWLELPDWPPAETETEAGRRTLRLGADGVLSEVPQGTATAGLGPRTGPRTVAHDPHDPAPSLGGRLFGVWPRPGPADQAEVERRPDVLTYTSAPLAAELDVVGTVRARLRVRASTAVADVVLRLCDVYPDGRSYPVAEHGHRLFSAPDRDQDLALDVGSTAWRVRPGHRIRLCVAPASWPRLAALPDRYTLTVIHAPDAPSWLELPTFRR
ncbi:CocE/NonD family hydrolase [Catenulispora pinisilvae]|uniref:CocE/NonD family hydrolase n=1 Tax=Catenulispora pinisilvae TaxID=2705253 RepID=UPI0018926081|nr:CocE/NonD family hydrolase [Catenulispora pinisilvae]